MSIWDIYRCLSKTFKSLMKSTNPHRETRVEAREREREGGKTGGD